MSSKKRKKFLEHYQSGDNSSTESSLLRRTEGNTVQDLQQRNMGHDRTVEDNVVRYDEKIQPDVPGNVGLKSSIAEEPLKLTSFEDLKNNECALFLPRNKNKSHPRGLTSKQLGMFNTELIENLSLYNSLSTQMRFDCIQNIMLKWYNNNYALWKAVDNKEGQLLGYRTLNDEETYVEIKKSFSTKMRNVSNTKKSQVKKVPSIIKFSPDQDIGAKFIRCSSIYKPTELFEMDFVRDWHYYSCIHSIYTSFSLYVYNYSHRVVHSDTQIVHDCTKVKLILPEDKNFYVLFHGRTVHSGSESRMVHVSSVLPSHDMRFFSYVRVKDKDKHWRNIRNDKKGLDYKDGQVERHKLKVCGLSSGTTCDICSKIQSTRVVDVSREYEIKEKQHGRTNVKRFPICGGMDEFGWEVRKGVDVRTTEFIMLKSELQSSLFKEKWKKISGTDRRMIVLGDSNNPLDIIDNYPALTKLRNKVSDELQKVFPAKYKDLELQRPSLLANFSFVMEQEPHRDYPNQD